MKTVYVIGPVIREQRSYDKYLRRGPDFEQIYHTIQSTLSNAGFDVILPKSESLLESAEPSSFYQTIAQRISSSDLVITLFPELDRSVPVEATMASFMEKDQYVIAGSIPRVPRLLRGLPRIKVVARLEAIEEVLNEVKSRNENPPVTLTH